MIIKSRRRPDAQGISAQPSQEYTQLVICDPEIFGPIIKRRQRRGQDAYDEVWDGEYVMSPIANDEHQDLTTGLVTIIRIVIGWSGLGEVRAGVNVSDRPEGWKQNYRVPEIAVFLVGTRAKNCITHWCGGPDFATEVVSKGDRSRKKLDFYGNIGTRELLIIDRFPWALELYGLKRKKMRLIGRSTPDDDEWLQSTVLPLAFRLVPGTPRPVIEVRHTEHDESWRV
jgi:Uma2 family endonuclease